MKKALLLFLFAISVLAGCKKEACNPEQTSSSYEEDKRIVVEYNFISEGPHYYRVGDGENLVFRYVYTAPECENTIDDEGGYTLTFEVDKDATEFLFEGIELPMANGFYKEFGAWVDGTTYPLEGGMIKGSRRSDGKWKVKADVTALPPTSNGSAKRITFDMVFEK